MPDLQTEYSEFSHESSKFCAVRGKREQQLDRESLKWVPYRHSVFCMPHWDGQQGFMLMNPYLFQDLVFPSRNTVNPSWTSSGTGCLRQAQERTPYPIVNYKEGCGDLFFHSMIHKQFLLGFISGASRLPRPFLNQDLGHLMHFNARNWAAVSFFKVLSMTQWFFSLVPAKNLPECLVLF